jgi:hypothetical protein
MCSLGLSIEVCGSDASAGASGTQDGGLKLGDNASAKPAWTTIERNAVAILIARSFNVWQARIAAASLRV